MAKVYTADEIIRLAREIAKIPNVAASGSQDSDLLYPLNMFLHSVLAPAIFSRREDYFTREVRTSIIPSVSKYRIDPRAILGAVRDVCYINSDGNRTDYFTRISRGEVQKYTVENAAVDEPSGFYIEGDYICLIPELGSGASGYLEQSVPLRPGELVLASATRTVTNVNTTSKTVTLSSAVPGTWSTSDTFDVHSPNSGAELRCWGKAASTVSGTSITFTTAIDGSLSGELLIEVGDYVCLDGESGVPAVPYEFHPVLAQALAATFIESQDLDGAKVHNARAKESIRVLLDAMSPRTEGKHPKLRTSTYLIGGYR